MLSSIDNMYFLQVKQIKKGLYNDSVLISSIQNESNIFEKKLEQETNNITETGESELVNKLHNDYREYLNIYQEIKSFRSFNEDNINQLYEQYSEVRKSTSGIYNLNMVAIQKKSNELQNLADDITIYMVIVAAISIIIALSFIFYFPSRIVEPIKRLTERIKSISERNYNQKLDVKTKDELGELTNAFNVMAERLRLYEAKHIDQLLFEQKRMESLMDNLEDGVLMIDENKKVVVANQTILNVTELKESDIVSHYIPDVAAHNDLIREIYKLALKINGDNDSDRPLRIVLNDKELFYKVEKEEIRTYSELSHKEAFIGYLILLKNITQFRARDVAKTNLLATVSHELKTPLSSINLSLKMLEDKRVGDLNKEQSDLVNALRTQSNRLLRVINEVMNYSQIETGNIKLRFSPVKPEDIIDLGVTALMLQISEKNTGPNNQIKA